ncbi:hypothetical protein AGMMS49975_18960 [Clostridia bacterium]|nr:hypothetical protein AGMMS49975_18960 [Clostridia bacterium]
MRVYDKRPNRAFFSFCFVLWTLVSMVLTLPLTAFAADDIDKSMVEQNVSAVATGKLNSDGDIEAGSLSPSQYFTYYKKEPPNGVSGQEYTITVTVTTTSGDKTTKEIDVWISDDRVKKSSINKEGGGDAAREKMKSFIEGANIEPDTDTALTVMSGFSGLISAAQGLILYAATIIAGLVNVLDILYCVSPWFQDKASEATSNSNSRLVTSTNKKTGEKKFRWVSHGAIRAVEDSAMSDTHVLLLWFQNSWVGVVILAILVIILASGDIAVIWMLAMKLVSGIVDGLKGLAN